MPTLLDLCCKAGGTSWGYHLAGFTVTGVDIERQPHYPFPERFIQADVLTLGLDFLRSFDYIAASPPCQAYSITRHQHRSKHPELIGPVRDLLLAAAVPYVIENVEGAPLHDPIRLCGSSFDLRVRRHRLFESSVPLKGKPCNHAWQDESQIYHISRSRNRGSYLSGVLPVYGGASHLINLYPWEKEIDIVSMAMGIDWMDRHELDQAIPPAYTKYIGRQLLESAV